MVMIFIFFFGVCFQATPYAYASEVLPTRTRARGMAFGLFLSNGITVMFTQCAPIAVAAITWKFSLIFIGCNLFFLPWVIFYFPEVFPTTY
jgi:Sugar (and other) transporter